MDANLSLDFSKLFKDYRHKRQLTSKLADEIATTLGRDDIVEAARRLGVWRDGSLAIESEAELCVLMDFAVFSRAINGENAAARYACAPRKLGDEKRDALSRMAAARYRILSIENSEPGIGLLVTDQLRGDSGFLVDRMLSITFDGSDAYLAGNVIEWGKFWSTTGASLPMAFKIWRPLEKRIHKRFGKPGAKYFGLSGDEQADLATWCVRTCLEEGMSLNVGYVDMGKRG